MSHGKNPRTTVEYSKEFGWFSMQFRASGTRKEKKLSYLLVIYQLQGNSNLSISLILLGYGDVFSGMGDSEPTIKRL